MALWQNALILRSQNIPLDYIVGCPSKSDLKMKQNKNMLKNIMFDKIIQTRVRKNKPKLKDILNYFNSQGQSKEYVLKTLESVFNKDKSNPHQEDL